MTDDTRHLDIRHSTMTDENYVAWLNNVQHGDIVYLQRFYPGKPGSLFDCTIDRWEYTRCKVYKSKGKLWDLKELHSYEDIRFDPLTGVATTKELFPSRIVPLKGEWHTFIYEPLWKHRAFITVDQPGKLKTLLRLSDLFERSYHFSDAHNLNVFVGFYDIKQPGYYDIHKLLSDNAITNATYCYSLP